MKSDMDIAAHDRTDSAGREADEALLWRAWIHEKNPDARNRLCEMHLPYARIVAATLFSRRTHNEIEFDDYLQLASLGMMESVDRYDPTQGAQFRTFASRRMQGSILNGLPKLTEKNQQIAVQGELRRDRLESAKKAALQAVEPRSPLTEDTLLPEGVGKNMQSLFVYLAEVGIGVAIGVMLEDTGMIDADAFGVDGASPSPEVSYFRQTHLQLLKTTLKDLVAQLSDQERTVVRCHYLQGVPFDEIGRMLNVKRSRVSQIHQEALRRLRQLLSRDVCDLSA